MERCPVKPITVYEARRVNWQGASAEETPVEMVLLADHSAKVNAIYADAEYWRAMFINADTEVRRLRNVIATIDRRAEAFEAMESELSQLRSMHKQMCDLAANRFHTIEAMRGALKMVIEIWSAPVYEYPEIVRHIIHISQAALALCDKEPTP